MLSLDVVRDEILKDFELISKEFCSLDVYCFQDEILKDFELDI